MASFFMHTYYNKDLSTEIIQLNDEEALHCFKVMRQKAGETIKVADGKGKIALAELVDVSRKKVSAKILSFEEQLDSEVSFHLVVAPTKNIARIEWLVEKSVEIGVGSISFIKCFNSERTKVKTDRLERIALSAMKQSQRSWLPSINEIQDLKTFLHSDALKNSNQKFVAHLDESRSKALLDSITPDSSVAVIVGPEGDFSKEELEMMISQGIEMVTLGKQRLRTETAALTAVQIVNLVHSK